MLISLRLVQSKYIKTYQIPLIGHNVLEFFCAPLYTDYLSDHHKKFQDNAKVEIQNLEILA